MPAKKTQPDETAGRVGPSVDRRDFLRLAGYSVGASFLSSCREASIEYIIPNPLPSEEVVPGVPVQYATVCQACPAGCGVLATCVDGRPIKLEGNPEHPISQGGMCAVGQASILELYDAERPRDPLIEKQQTSWNELDRRLAGQLGSLNGGEIYFLTGTGLGPATEWTVGRFLEYLGRGRHLSYDPLGGSLVTEAHLRTHKVKAAPRYDLARAEVIVGIEADFLGHWISPVEFAQGYRSARFLEGSRLKFSSHWHFESGWSLSGSKADQRFALHPSQMGNLLVSLARELSGKSGQDLGLPDVRCPIDESALLKMVDLLWENRGRSLLLCGVEQLDPQIVTSLINHLLQNYGRTADLVFPSHQKHGDEGKLIELLEDLRRERVGAVFCNGVNPVYDMPFGEELGRLLEKVPVSVAFGHHLDETAARLKMFCPTPHYLESWTDAFPSARVRSLVQPVFPRYRGTRPLVESLSTWMGNPRGDREIVREYWEGHVFPKRMGFEPFEEFWNKTLHDGQAGIRPERTEAASFDWEVAAQAVRRLAEKGREDSEENWLVVIPSRTIRDSGHAHNPWLQELPDPLTRLSWGNCLEIGSQLAARLDLTTGDLVEVSPESPSVPGGQALTLPAVVLPGIADRTVVVSSGYGGRLSERLSGLGPNWREGEPQAAREPIGQSVSRWCRFDDGFRHQVVPGVRIRKTGRRSSLPLAQVDGEESAGSQWFRDKHGSGVIREMTLTDLISTPPAVQEERGVSPWDAEHRYPGNHWEMTVDLGACTGCSACVIACQAENNIPVVGREEVKRRRSMHWIRIDRHFSGSESDPRIRFLPVLCQHCDSAPCEAVCPVFATVHCAEGLNDQVYNRCIGTRYCANNCPYQVRVFNWFDYSRGPTFESLFLNPEVTVRSRGVMEKCTFCVQRIQSAKRKAAAENRKLLDGEIQTACEQSCPSRAITFGNLNDPQSGVARLARSSRSYQLLAELGTVPSVHYLAAVNNRSEEPEDG